MDMAIAHESVLVSADQVLAGYDAVCALYPHVPSLSHWRAWEFAAYQRYELPGRTLDLGCGDGGYFRLLWPDASDVVGVEIDPVVAELGRQSGVYTKVHVAPAHRVPEPDASFDQVFANCSLEHMDHLDAVLAEIHRCLRPGGRLLCSVVTERFSQWALLPNLVEMSGFAEAADVLRADFAEYHHLSNPLPVAQWKGQFSKAGLSCEEHIPILPEWNSGIFLLMDGLWHLKRQGKGELGEVIHPFLARNERFPHAFRSVLAGLLDMEMDWNDCSGAVFLVRKPAGAT